MLGNDINITYIESLISFNNTFKYEILNDKNMKKYLKNESKDIEILITTRIDYDDRIYYDAVNDVRKIINLERPLLLHGYNRGVYYLESNGKYFEFYNSFNNEGAMSIFLSLIVVLSKVNGTYTIYDLQGHPTSRTTLLKIYKSFGIKDLNYEPAIFDNGEYKFVYVRQNYSAMYHSIWYKGNKTVYNFNLSKFYSHMIIKISVNYSI